jgi:hypothetical protein
VGTALRRYSDGEWLSRIRPRIVARLKNHGWKDSDEMPIVLHRRTTRLNPIAPSKNRPSSSSPCSGCGNPHCAV